MKKKIYICGIACVLFLIACIAAMFQYKKPKEYCILETPIKMCDKTGENVIEMTCELYLQRYFLKGSEIHGNIYVNGVKYTSIFDLDGWYRMWAKEWSKENGFLAKLGGRKFAVPFIDLEYWTMLEEKDLHRDYFFQQSCIDKSISIRPKDNIFHFALYGENKERVSYIGPAENAEEYKEVTRRMAILDGAIQEPVE